MAMVLVVMSAGAAWGSRLQSPPSTDQYGPNRVVVCHRVSAKPQRFADLTISRASLATHLRHGDTVGACVYGSVNSRGVVALRTGRGVRIATLRARRIYSIVVTDPSPTQNFHLSGRAVSRATSVRFVGTVRWKVTFAVGTYRYRSDARPTLRRFVAVR